MGTHRAPALQEPAVKSLKSLLFCSVAVAASLPAFACYTVYDGANRIAYQGERAPVDMSLPLHEAMQASYPGGQLVFDLDASCPAIVTGRLAPARTASPLLTDQRTARALHVPFTTVGPTSRWCSRATPAWNRASRWCRPRTLQPHGPPRAR